MDEDAKKVYKEVHELEPLFSMLIETLNRNLLQICDLCRGNVPETLYNFVGLAIGVIAEMIKISLNAATATPSQARMEARTFQNVKGPGACVALPRYICNRKAKIGHQGTAQEMLC
ncbi:hypothetical protein P8452_09217 [Trifolium repens]|nr:hypothetical protein P8452_09217 [Trifolium repens]